MAKRVINIGTAPGDGTGDAFRTAFEKVNDNFTELYDIVEKPARRGFDINGRVFLLVLFSLFAGLYYLGGVKSRREVKSLALELRVMREGLSVHQAMVKEQDAVIIQLNSALNLSLTQWKQCEGRYGEAIKRESILRKELEEARVTKCDTIFIMPFL